MELNIPDSDIREVENILLPEEHHFPDDALEVIRCWHSVDVSACAGSGKTTVLLAKLKLLADRMPFSNGAGICVLSHTNVAVKEIKRKLIGYTDKLMSYPNYVGTIQTFIDRFVTMPYIRQITGRSVKPVDEITYAQHMLLRKGYAKYRDFFYLVNSSYNQSGNKKYPSLLEFISKIYISNEKKLCIASQVRPLAGEDKNSTKQFIKLKKELLEEEGIITYQDSYNYANEAIDNLSDEYIKLFNQRFLYVFIDEYQDCNDTQREALNKLFDDTKCVLFRIGDPDQAIYQSDSESTRDWQPCEGFLPMKLSHRYNQKIANILSPLCKNETNIMSSLQEEACNPVLIIYDDATIDKVLDTFVSILDERGLHDPGGIYKAIGFIKKEDSAGIKISSYWKNFSSSKKANSEYKYWDFVNEISSQLQQGKLYGAEKLLRRLICRLYHYAGKKDGTGGKEYTVISIRNVLKENNNVEYGEKVLSLARLNDYNPESIDSAICSILNGLWYDGLEERKSVFKSIPKFFMEPTEPNQKIECDKNVFVEPLRGRQIKFDTVHGVKGETHDATLYLETETHKGSDIGRVLCRYGIGKAGDSHIFDYSRKIVYVGMSRPRKLLCLAIKSETYNKGKVAFESWDRVDIRSNKVLSS